MTSLFIGVAMMNTATVAVTTVSTLIVADSAGARLSGFANAAGVLGSAIGALGLGAVTARRGGSFALTVVYSSAVAGAVAAFAGAAGAGLAALLVGLVLIGVGNGGAQVSRYLAADMYPEDRKASALSIIVWAGTVGALTGPNLVAPAGRFAEAMRLPELSGTVLTAVMLVIVALTITRLLPPSGEPPRVSRPSALSLSRVRALVRLPAVATALCAMLGAHLSMVTVMTMTPLQLHDQHHGLNVVGMVLSAHMIGMFALAPLSGRLTDLWGGRWTVSAGVVLLVAAALIVGIAPTGHTTTLPAGLFLLGYGWNLVFVGSSSMLSGQLDPVERSEVQGGVDAIVFTASIVASLAAGALFAGGGFAAVAVAGGLMALVPIPWLLAYRQSRPEPERLPSSRPTAEAESTRPGSRPGR
ncbi:MFS transporter [Micromonospora zamorensis]|uniref:MFS transporter n=1 Tax=Micromonospora zamorensis TaxID=709883 RepID=UPI003D990183